MQRNQMQQCRPNGPSKPTRAASGYSGGGSAGPRRHGSRFSAGGSGGGRSSACICVQPTRARARRQERLMHGFTTLAARAPAVLSAGRASPASTRLQLWCALAARAAAARDRNHPTWAKGTKAK